jgi:peptide/nickel transport system substrate-binding protein
MKLNTKLSLIVILLLVFSLFLGLQVMAAADRLKIAIPGKAQTIDPSFLHRVISEWPIMNSVYNGLVRYKPGTFEVEPDLATGWELSKDNREITFHLRKGVQFHKGYGEFTAEDVKFSFERIIDPEEKSLEKNSFASLKKVEVVDKYTAKLIFEEPMARLFTSTLPFNAGLIVSKKAIEEMGKEEFGHNPIGTGPYEFKEWGVNNNIILVKNENYWDQNAYFNTVEFIPMPDPTAQEIALQSGGIDIGEVTLDNINRMKEYSKLNVEIYPDLATQYIAFNVKKAPMDNIYLREALRYIIDPREILIGVYAGYAERAYSLILPDMLGWRKAPEYNIEDIGEEKVWELLDKAGYPEGKGLELDYVVTNSEERILAATLIQAQLAKFNIKLNIEAIEIGPKIEKWQAGEYHITYTRFSNTVDPGYCYQWNVSEQIGKWNLFHWSNKEFDRLWTEAEVNMDEKNRAEQYKEMQKMMDEEAIGMWITHGVRTPGWVKDVEPVFSPDGIVLPWLVESK